MDYLRVGRRTALLMLEKICSGARQATILYSIFVGTCRMPVD